MKKITLTLVLLIISAWIVSCWAGRIIIEDYTTCLSDPNRSRANSMFFGQEYYNTDGERIQRTAIWDRHDGMMRIYNGTDPNDRNLLEEYYTERLYLNSSYITIDDATIDGYFSISISRSGVEYDDIAAYIDYELYDPMVTWFDYLYMGSHPEDLTVQLYNAETVE